jgi:hypothetical protein
VELQETRHLFEYADRAYTMLEAALTAEYRKRHCQHGKDRPRWMSPPNRRPLTELNIFLISTCHLDDGQAFTRALDKEIEFWISVIRDLGIQATKPNPSLVHYLLSDHYDLLRKSIARPAETRIEEFRLVQDFCRGLRCAASARIGVG